MACHYPDPAAAETLRQALVAMNFPDHLGLDAPESEYGVAYKRVTAVDSDPETLAQMACAHLSRELASGATAIVWRKLPIINGFEERREHSFALVLEYHTLAGVQDATEGVSDDGRASPSETQPSDAVS